MYTKNKTTNIMQFQLFISYKPACLQRNFSWTSTIHPSIFLGQALWADSVTTQMNTIASRDQLHFCKTNKNWKKFSGELQWKLWLIVNK